MITLIEKKINIFEENNSRNLLNKELIQEKLLKLIEIYQKTDNFGYLECPYCHSDKLIRYGYYSRNIGCFGEYYEVFIKRCKCKECGHTHALIPSFIVPYFQEFKEYILVCISEIVIEEESIMSVSDKLNITRQVISFWVKRFNMHLTRLKTTFSYDLKKLMEILFSGMKAWKKYEFINGIRILENVTT